MLPAIRLMDFTDISVVREISTEAAGAAWTELVLRKYLQSKKTYGILAVNRSNPTEVYGYLLYGRGKPNVVCLWNLAVRPEWQQRGVATYMVNQALAGSVTKSPLELYSRCEEDNLPAQLFFKSCGMIGEVEEFADGRCLKFLRIMEHPFILHSTVEEPPRRR